MYTYFNLWFETIVSKGMIRKDYWPIYIYIKKNYRERGNQK